MCPLTRRILKRNESWFCYSSRSFEKEGHHALSNNNPFNNMAGQTTSVIILSPGISRIIDIYTIQNPPNIAGQALLNTFSLSPKPSIQIPNTCPLCKMYPSVIRIYAENMAVRNLIILNCYFRAEEKKRHPYKKDTK